MNSCSTTTLNQQQAAKKHSAASGPSTLASGQTPDFKNILPPAPSRPRTGSCTAQRPSATLRRTTTTITIITTATTTTATAAAATTRMNGYADWPPIKRFCAPTNPHATARLSSTPFQPLPLQSTKTIPAHDPTVSIRPLTPIHVPQ
ncbi:salivary glue protein Sgs-3-like [Portunus trituberculatus]|uniref:salivary glue protein Sgs-3-like n=1 Tax=Portunus trituberculatus TaxID=210409 RepID=UPI001E1CF1FE|nr:salivary glue protein Sgs-3-like [Portunus trituberculatus]